MQLRVDRISLTVRQQITARDGEIYDTLGWEIGHLINQLIKGNVNAIWYVTSPLVIKPSNIQEELSAPVQANLCRTVPTRMLSVSFFCGCDWKRWQEE
ncbi:MAG: hypothetical protein M0Q43_06805 [Methanothrix sp.]|nr:hypothetical protein [Methanothrix sp.]